MADEKPKIDLSIRDIQELGFGTHSYKQGANEPPPVSLGNAMTNNFYGLNHRQTPQPIPMSKDRYGYTFFTRPQLNMQKPNLQQNRKMYPLLTTDPVSYQRAIRCWLDPRLMAGYGDGTAEGGGIALTCPIVDNQQAFISVLSNDLVSMSGWPDISVPMFSARVGPYKEEYSLVDGTTIDYSAYNVTASFRNSKGDTITQLFEMWENYMGAVFENLMTPYFDFITDNMLDYTTRIYRIVMDPTNRKVQRLASCGAAIPMSVPIGAMFDFDASKPYNDANAQIAIQFRCMGFIVNDDINIRTFNATVGIFNERMRTKGERFGKTTPQDSMMAIPHQHLPLFNNRGYPRIDPKTREMQWWISKDHYQQRMAGFRDLDSSLDSALGLNLSYTPSQG